MTGVNPYTTDFHGFSAGIRKHAFFPRPPGSERYADPRDHAAASGGDVNKYENLEGPLDRITGMLPERWRRRAAGISERRAEDLEHFSKNIVADMMKRDAASYGMKRYRNMGWWDKLKIILGELGNRVAGAFGIDGDPFGGLSGYKRNTAFDYLERQGLDIAEEDRDQFEFSGDGGYGDLLKQIRNHETYGDDYREIREGIRNNTGKAVKYVKKEYYPDDGWNEFSGRIEKNPEELRSRIEAVQRDPEFRKSDVYDPSGARFISEENVLKPEEFSDKGGLFAEMASKSVPGFGNTEK